MTQYQQHANLLRGDDTEMDGPSMEEYIAPVQQQAYQRPIQPNSDKTMNDYINEQNPENQPQEEFKRPVQADWAPTANTYLKGQAPVLDAAAKYATAKAMKQKIYIDSLKIDSIPRYNELIARGDVIDSNNPAIRAIHQGLLATQDKPAPQQPRYSINEVQAKEPVTQLDAMRNIANDRRQGQLPYQGTFDLMKSMGYASPNKPTDIAMYDPQDVIVEPSRMNRFGA